MNQARGARADALRRYPALAFLAIAAVLAAVLPSALTVPNTGPPTLAEFAPVPGNGGPGGDLGRLGSGSSGGLGFGSGDGSSGTGGIPPDPGQPVSNLKDCVGTPPRQTEDPLSPPCVAFFGGENFGDTARGVTAEEIRIVIHTGPATEERMHDLADPDDVDVSAVEEAHNNVARAFVRYFTARYQTYGRRVHAWTYKGPGSTPAEIKASIKTMVEQVDPFAVIAMGSNGAQAVAKEAARRGLLSISYGAFDRSEQRRLAPLLLSYAPDLQDEARIIASFVCDKLVGRPARFSGNPGDTDTTRSFGLLAQDRADEPELVRMMELTAEALEDECGLRGLPSATVSTANEDQADYAISLATMRTEEVTTIIAFSRTTGPSFWGAAANAQGWYPEWVIPGRTGFTGVDENENGRQYSPTFWKNAFGVSYDRLRVELDQQQWFHAYKEGCPSCPSTSDFRNAKLYDSLTLLMWGVQAAGPRLTAENIDKGLHAIPARASSNPDIPAAYFAPGNYSWIKDAMAIWWDPAGSDPDGEVGCFRLARGGRRYRTGEWPRGDRDLFASDAPCQGPAR